MVVDELSMSTTNFAILDYCSPFSLGRIFYQSSGYRAALRLRATTLVSTQIADRYSGSARIKSGGIDIGCYQQR
jgi:hypothetical protein